MNDASNGNRELDDSELAIVAGGFGRFVAQAFSGGKDEGPKETITFEYGGLPIHYSQQSASGSL